MGGVAVVLRVVVVGHPRRILCRVGLFERGVGFSDRAQGVGYVAHLAEGSGACRVQHGTLGRGQSVGTHQTLLCVGQASIRISDPDFLPGHERVRLGAQVPLPGFFRALSGQPEADSGIVVGVRVELRGADDNPQPSDRG
ncbi:hypothetical protein GCM10023238_26860 [Streptomyces heliomycini]